MLGQWRGYGNQGGYCIEFDCRRLSEMLVKEASSFLNIGTQLSDVVYSDDEQRYEQEFDSELEAIEAFLRDSFIMRVQNPDIEPDTGLFLTSFIRCLACFKHRAFKEEKEVRLVWTSVKQKEKETEEQEPGSKSVMNIKQKRTLFRGKDQSIPYISIFDDTRERLPVSRIIVGPQRDQDEKANVISEEFKGLGIPIDRSDIPFSGREA